MVLFWLIESSSQFALKSVVWLIRRTLKLVWPRITDLKSSTVTNPRATTKPLRESAGGHLRVKELMSPQSLFVEKSIRITIEMGISRNGLVAYQLYEGSMDGEDFITYVKNLVYHQAYRLANQDEPVPSR